MRTFDEHKGSVMGVDFDLVNNRLVSCSADKTLKVWDLRRDERALQTLQGHSKGVFAVKMDFFKIISGSEDSTVRIWNFD